MVAIPIETKESAHPAAQKQTILPPLEDSKPHPSKAPHSTVAMSATLTKSAVVQGNDTKVVKYAVHENGVELPRKPANQPTHANPALTHNVQKSVTKERPTFEAPPLASNTSNYHHSRKSTEAVLTQDSTTLDREPQSPKKNSLKYKRYFDDKKALDVALARARRAVKRQRDITSGRMRGRLNGNTYIGHDTSYQLPSHTIKTHGPLMLNIIGKNAPNQPHLPSKVKARSRSNTMIASENQQRLPS